MKESRDTSRRILYWILAIAFLLRIATAALAHMHGFFSDEQEYLYLARQLNEGMGFVDSNGAYSVKVPVFPALLALCFRVWPSSLVLPFLLVALVSTLSVYAGYHLALSLWKDRMVALYSSGLLAFFPSLVLYGGLLMTESLFILLLLLTLLTAERLRHDDRVLLHVLFGILAGVAVLTRAAGLGLIPLILIIVALARRTAGLRSHRLLIAFGVWCLVISPWSIRNSIVHQRLIPLSTFGSRAFLTGSNPYAHGTAKLDPGFNGWLESELKKRGFRPEEALTEADQFSLEQSIGLEYAVSHPGRFLTLAFQKAHVFWIYPVTYGQDNRFFQASFLIFDMLLLMGAIGGAAASAIKWRSFAIVWGVIAFFTLMNMVLYAEARFRLPVVPLVCVLCAGSAHLLNADIRRSLYANARARALLIGGFAVVILLYGFTGALFLAGAIS